VRRFIKNLRRFVGVYLDSYYSKKQKNVVFSKKAAYDMIKNKQKEFDMFETLLPVNENCATLMLIHSKTTRKGVAIWKLNG